MSMLNQNRIKNFNLRYARWFSFLVGLAIFALIVVTVYRSNIVVYRHFINFYILIPWFAISLLARLLMTEVFVRPIRALSYSLSWPAAFWLGWLRTFFNQFVPWSGLTLVVAYCKKKCGLAWGEIGALSSPLFLLSLSVTGALATGAILGGADLLGSSFVPLLSASLLISGIPGVIIIRGSVGIAILPHIVRRRLGPLEKSLRLFEGHGRLMIRLSVCYSGIILLRCLRLWLLFALSTNLNLGLQEVVLLAMISEFGFLVPLIPGGIGVREGALVSVAWLLGLNIEIVAAVAVMDRLFTICLVAIMAMPAYFVLRREIVAVP
jgi:uncharacterized membrane protein YbhN (UPF0104 family)